MSPTELKDRVDTKTVNMVLLTFATGGLYPLLWLSRVYPILDGITKVKTATQTYVIWVAVCVGLGGLFMRAQEDEMAGLGFLISLAANVMYIVWSFSAKKALEEYALQNFKIDLRMNAFYTFVFNVYYINYCINHIPEADRRQKILVGDTPA
ncbi:hypothetical protein EV700_1550 [Fluviicoccus keumensis]|uniref:DUF4234 domain-containing protein n=1 Tax=Fluviicoccus keumensis TaxID=1435465 RepID=A0A4Q7Z9D9_9GAMM|nr:hypothetical protein EV700_1550 [Fluviicoccus keumensis]